MFKMATWNVNSLKMRLAHILFWLKKEQPDVLALQEIKTVDAEFAREQLQEIGYNLTYNGQKAYNGVAFISRHPLSDVELSFPGFDDPQKRILIASVAGKRLVNLYVPNGSSIDSDKYQYKLRWLACLTDYLQELRHQFKDIIVVGDFNIAPENRDVHDPKAWEGKILVSQRERQALQYLFECGYIDLFRQFEQKTVFSWWDYRAAAFRRNLGLRIDLILSNIESAQKCTSCYIDQEPRGWEKPSDHAPVLAEF